jgi:hypothetical protein
VHCEISEALQRLPGQVAGIAGVAIEDHQLGRSRVHGAAIQGVGGISSSHSGAA